MTRGLRALYWIVFACLQPALAQADDTYEWARTQKLLDDSDLTVAARPTGKRIAYVRIVRDDVFVEDELWPVWLNWFHHLSQDSMVRRELLFSPGEAYTPALIEETMRNLRSMGVFALVRIVAVRTEDPDTVGVVVHTRDLWSLRLETAANLDFSFNNLQVVLVERNLAGLNKALGGEIQLLPDKYSLQESYVARRILGSNLRLEQFQGVTFGRFQDGAEGSFGGVTVSRPFYRLAQRFAWSIGGAYSIGITRALDERENFQVYESESGEEANAVYDDNSGAASASVAARFGDEVKIALGTGVRYLERNTSPNAETELPESIRDEFEENFLPLSRRDLGPRFSYDMFLARYRTLVNFGSFGQSENVRVGPSVSLEVFVPVAGVGSTANAMVLTGTLATTHTRGRGLFSVSAEGTSRLQQGQLIDQRLLSQVRFATPTFGPMRLITRLALDARRRDSQQTFVSLGSDRGLRGYQARTFSGFGASRVLANVELRSLPWKIRSLHLGAVLFYDVGSVYRRTSNVVLHHAVGAGIRFLFPQFNRYPFSYDVGVPTDPDFRFTPTFNTSQIVPITDLEEDSFP